MPPTAALAGRFLERLPRGSSNGRVSSSGGGSGSRQSATAISTGTGALRSAITYQIHATRTVIAQFRSDRFRWPPPLLYAPPSARARRLPCSRVRDPSQYPDPEIYSTSGFGPTLFPTARSALCSRFRACSKTRAPPADTFFPLGTLSIYLEPCDPTNQ